MSLPSGSRPIQRLRRLRETLPGPRKTAVLAVIHLSAAHVPRSDPRCSHHNTSAAPRRSPR